jgi:MFS family permease
MLTASVVGLVIGGVWGDARGAGLPITAGGAVFVAGLVLSGFAGSMPVFVLGRLVQGLGGGAALTAMYVAVGDAYVPELRPRIFSLFATAWVLPSIAGPFVAGALVDLVGWRSVFLVVAVFAAGSVVAVRTSLHGLLQLRNEPIAWDRRPLYAVVATAGVVLLHLAGHRAGSLAAALVAAGVALVLVAAPRLLPRGTFRGVRGLPAVVAARGLAGAAFACVEIFVPLVLQDESGISPTVSGLVMMVGALGWTAGSAYSGRHARPGTFDKLLRTGALSLVTGSLIMLGLVPAEHTAWAAGVVAGVGFAVLAIGMGLVTPLMSTLSLDLAAPGRQGESGAAIQMSDALGQSVAAGVVGAVFARWYVVAQHTSYLSGLGLALVFAVLTLLIVGRATARG